MLMELRNLKNSSTLPVAFHVDVDAARVNAEYLCITSKGIFLNNTIAYIPLWHAERHGSDGLRTLSGELILLR